MIPLETIRTALTHTDPSAALHAIITRELEQGRTTAEIYDELKTEMPEIMTWPEYHGQVEEDLDGMFDRLRGWCHPSQRYVSKSQPTLADTELQLLSTLLEKHEPALLHRTIDELHLAMRSAPQAAITSSNSDSLGRVWAK